MFLLFTVTFEDGILLAGVWIILGVMKFGIQLHGLNFYLFIQFFISSLIWLSYIKLSLQLAWIVNIYHWPTDYSKYFTIEKFRISRVLYKWFRFYFELENAETKNFILGNATKFVAIFLWFDFKKPENL